MCSIIVCNQREINGLNVLQSSNTIRVPKVYCQGSFENTHFVILEYFEFTRGSKVFTIVRFDV